jgi:hypothetical protein
MECIEANPCVYISKTKPHLFLTLFVDDGLAYCAFQAKLDALILYMEQRLITCSSVDLYVGLHIHQEADRKMLFVNQSIYIRHILSKFGFMHYQPVTNPTDSNNKLDDT